MSQTFNHSGAPLFRKFQNFTFYFVPRIIANLPSQCKFQRQLQSSVVTHVINADQVGDEVDRNLQWEHWKKMNNEGDVVIAKEPARGHVRTNLRTTNRKSPHSTILLVSIWTLFKLVSSFLHNLAFRQTNFKKPHEV